MGPILGDFGTLFPLAIGYIVVCGLNPAGFLVMMGLANIVTGLVYRLPMPIEPMKVLAVVAIAQHWSPSMVYASGFAMGVIWLLFAVTGLMGWIARGTPNSVIRGIQVALGVLLAVEALKKFKESLDVVYGEIEEPSTPIDSAFEVMIRLNNSITRGFQYLNYVENLAHILEAKGYDTAVIEDKIQSARGLLQKALSDLYQHRFQSVGDTLLMVKGLLGTLRERLVLISLDLKVSRLETYIVDADERLDLLEATVLSLSSELSPEAKNASLTALQDAEANLDNARSYLEAQRVSEVVHELMQSREREEEALRIINENQTSAGSVSELGTNSSSYLEQVS